MSARKKLTTLVESLGLAAISAAAWTVNPTVGFAVTGVALVVAGLAVERDKP